MRIEFNGAMIYFEGEEFQEVSDLRCMCGHTVLEHGSPVHWGSKPYWIPVSQCILCNCSQFKISETPSE